MADFSGSTAKNQSVARAVNLLDLVRAFYVQGSLIQEALDLYAAGTDPAFNATVNALFTAAQRAELNAMLTPITAILLDWEANHASAIGVL